MLTGRPKYARVAAIKRVSRTALSNTMISTCVRVTMLLVIAADFTLGRLLVGRDDLLYANYDGPRVLRPYGVPDGKLHDLLTESAK